MFTVYLIATIYKFVKTCKVNKKLKALSVAYGITMTIYLVLGEAYVPIVIHDYFNAG